MPEKMAPATKYGGKIVVCQPGTTAVAKSGETMVWTESTSGVPSAPTNRETPPERPQRRADAGREVGGDDGVAREHERRPERRQQQVDPLVAMPDAERSGPAKTEEP